MLSESEILDQYEKSALVIRPFDRDSVKGASCDLKLGEHYFTEHKPDDYDKNKLRPNYMNILNIYDETVSNKRWDGPHQAKMKKEIPDLYGYPGIHPEDRVILLKPKELILAHSIEFAGGKKPYTTEIRTRSSYARNGIFTVKCAGVGDPGFINRWTLEIVNESQYYTIPLVVGRRIAQLRFIETKGEDMQSYDENGKYQDNTTDVDELEAKWNQYMLLPKLYKDRETVAVGDISKLEPPRTPYITPAVQRVETTHTVQQPPQPIPPAPQPVVQQLQQPVVQSFQQRQHVAQPQSTHQTYSTQKSASMSIQQMQQVAQLQQNRQLQQIQQPVYQQQQQSVQSFQQQQIQSQLQGQVQPIPQLIQPVNMRQNPNQQVQIQQVRTTKKVKDKGEEMIVDPFAGNKSHTPLDKPIIDPTQVVDEGPVVVEYKMITVPDEDTPVPPIIASGAAFDECMTSKMKELENPDNIVTIGVGPVARPQIRVAAPIEPQYYQQQPVQHQQQIPSYVYQEPPPQPPAMKTKIAVPVQTKKKVGVRRTTRT